MLKKVMALLLAFAMLLAMPALAADVPLAADETASTEGDGADQVLGMVEEILFKNKVELLLDIIEQYSLYEYEGDASVLLEAVVAYFADKPEEFEQFADALFQTQDSFSHYMEAETYDDSYVMNDEFVGIGIELENANDGLIKVVYPNSPAEEAGIKSGDDIVAVNGVYIPEGEFYIYLQRDLRGPEGEAVSVAVLRDGEELTFEMVRRKVELSNISVADLGDGIAYVRIAHFGDDLSTFVDFINSYSELGSEGFTRVIFDVRDNNGGDASILANILNYTLWDKGAVMFTENSAAAGAYTHTSLGLGWVPESVCVLVNRYTASSAEIFAAVLKDVAGATIVGEDEATYGKGLGQYVFQLSDGSMAIITGSEALIGESMTSYHGVGIKPDYVVPVEYEVISEPVELEPINTAREFYPGAKGAIVLAVEQRLGLLGYLDGEADNVYDAASQAAMDAFREANGIRVNDLVTSEALAAIDAATAGMVIPGTMTSSDAALAKAIELSK